VVKVLASTWPTLTAKTQAATKHFKRNICASYNSVEPRNRFCSGRVSKMRHESVAQWERTDFETQSCPKVSRAFAAKVQSQA